MEFHSGSSCLVNTKRAVAECLDEALGASGTDCDLLVLYVTMGHNFPDILTEANRLAPHALVAMAIRGPQDGFAVAGLRSIDEIDFYEAGVRIATELWAQNPRISFILLHFSPFRYACGPIEDAIRGVESVFGPHVPIIGGLSMDNNKVVTCFQFFQDRVFEKGAVAVGFADLDLEVVCRANHGFTVIGEPFVATRTQRNHIHELDHEPAWERLCERLGLGNDAEPMDLFPYVGLAQELPTELHAEYGAEYLARFAAALVDNEGGIYCYHDVQAGARLWLLRRDEQGIADGVGYLTSQLLAELKGRRPMAIFHADCLLRGKLMFNHIVKEETVASVQRPFGPKHDVPWLGMYCGGEIGPLGRRNTIHLFTSCGSIIMERTV